MKIFINGTNGSDGVLDASFDSQQEADSFWRAITQWYFGIGCYLGWTFSFTEVRPDGTTFVSRNCGPVCLTPGP